MSFKEHGLARYGQLIDRHIAQAKSLAAPSYTTLGGNYCIRAAIVNHRTEEGDLSVLVEAVRRLGHELT